MTISLRQIATDIAALRSLGDDHLPMIERLVAPLLTGYMRDILREDPSGPGLLPVRSLDGPLFRDPHIPAIGRIPLPDDFFELVYIRMEGWDHEITRLVTPGDPEYALRSSPWPEISGSVMSPRCYLVTTGGRKWLEYRCADAKARCLGAAYHPVPSLRRGHIEIPEGIYHRLISTLKPLYNVPDSDLR